MSIPVLAGIVHSTRSWIYCNKLLALILLLGLALRLAPIGWGLPLTPFTRGYHPDESKIYTTVVEFPGVYITTGQFRGYGTAVQYFIGLLLLPVKLAFILLGGPRGSYVLICWLASRLFGVAAGVLGILLLHRLARKLFDREVALLSAVYLTLSLYHVMNSALATLDVPMSTLLLLNFLLCFRADERQTLSSCILLGIATGVLIGTKLTGGIFLAFPLALGLLRGGRVWPRLRLYLLYCFVASAVYVLLNPHFFVGFEQTVAFYAQEKIDWIDRTRGTFGDLVHRWGDSTGRAVGVGVSLAALVGAFFPGKKMLRYKLALLAFVALSYLFWGWFLLPRYVIVAAPIFCLWAAHLSLMLIRHRQSPVRWSGALVIAACIVPSAYHCAGGIYLRLNDTRPAVSRFIQETYPRGSSIGFSSISEEFTWKTHPWRYPKIDWDRYEERFLLDAPDVLVVSSIDLKPVLKALRSVVHGPDYLLPEEHRRDWYRYSAPSPRMFRFYDRLLNPGSSSYALVRTFEPKLRAPIEFPPPGIRIYKKDDAGTIAR